jgi:hypothetical protein
MSKTKATKRAAPEGAVPSPSSEQFEALFFGPEADRREAVERYNREALAYRISGDALHAWMAYIDLRESGQSIEPMAPFFDAVAAAIVRVARNPESDWGDYGKALRVRVRARGDSALEQYKRDKQNVEAILRLNHIRQVRKLVRSDFDQVAKAYSLEPDTLQRIYKKNTKTPKAAAHEQEADLATPAPTTVSPWPVGMWRRGSTAT